MWCSSLAVSLAFYSSVSASALYCSFVGKIRKSEIALCSSRVTAVPTAPSCSTMCTNSRGGCCGLRAYSKFTQQSYQSPILDRLENEDPQILLYRLRLQRYSSTTFSRQDAPPPGFNFDNALKFCTRI